MNRTREILAAFLVVSALATGAAVAADLPAPHLVGVSSSLDGATYMVRWSHPEGTQIALLLAAAGGARDEAIVATGVMRLDDTSRLLEDRFDRDDSGVAAIFVRNGEAAPRLTVAVGFLWRASDEPPRFEPLGTGPELDLATAPLEAALGSGGPVALGTDGYQLVVRGSCEFGGVTLRFHLSGGEPKGLRYDIYRIAGQGPGDASTRELIATVHGGAADVHDRLVHDSFVDQRAGWPTAIRYMIVAKMVVSGGFQPLEDDRLDPTRRDGLERPVYVVVAVAQTEVDCR